MLDRYIDDVLGGASPPRPVEDGALAGACVFASLLVAEAADLPAFDARASVRARVLSSTVGVGRRRRSRRRLLAARNVIAVAIGVVLVTAGLALADALPASVERVASRMAQSVGLDRPALSIRSPRLTGAPVVEAVARIVESSPEATPTAHSARRRSVRAGAAREAERSAPARTATGAAPTAPDEDRSNFERITDDERSPAASPRTGATKPADEPVQHGSDSPDSSAGSGDSGSEGGGGSDDDGRGGDDGGGDSGGGGEGPDGSG